MPELSIGLVIGFVVVFAIGVVIGIASEFTHATIDSTQVDDALPSQATIQNMVEDYGERLQRIAALPTDNQPTRNLKKAIQIAREG